MTAGNAGDASVAEQLISDLLAQHRSSTQPGTAETTTAETTTADSETGQDERATGGTETPRVYGDNAYGTGAFHDQLEQAGIEDRCKTQQPAAAGGRFAKDRFTIDLRADRARCPAGHTARIWWRSNGTGTVNFWPYCTHCPLRQQCTTAPNGRTVTVGAYERQLAAARARQRDSDWITDYRSTRPKVERKIAHLMRRRHGGRRARMRGREKIAADFNLLAAAHNLARLAVLGLRSNPTAWAVAAG